MWSELSPFQHHHHKTTWRGKEGSGWPQAQLLSHKMKEGKLEKAAQEVRKAVATQEERKLKFNTLSQENIFC